MKCLVCNSQMVIMSGVDAIVLGVVTEKFCYNCAKAYRMVGDIMKDIIEKEQV